MGKLFLFSIFLMFWGECFSLEEDLSQTDKAPWKPLIECDDYLFSIGKFLSPKSYIKYCLLSKREGALLTQGILSKIVFRYDKKWVQSFFRPCIKDSNEDWRLLLQNCSKILNCGNQLEVRCDKSLENPKIPKEFIHFINTAHHFNTFFLQGYDDHIDLMAVIKEIKRKNVFFKVFVDFKNVKSPSDFLDAFKDNFIIRAGISYIPFSQEDFLKLLQSPIFYNLKALFIHTYEKIPDEIFKTLIDSGIIKSLRSLDLSRTLLTSEKALELILCDQLNKLEFLDLSHNSINSLKDFEELIKAAPKLKELDLSFNKVSLQQVKEKFSQNIHFKVIFEELTKKVF